MSNFTVDYYNQHAEEYAGRAATEAEVQPFYDIIEPMLPAKAKILDFGCGTGRDSLHFAKCGFDVVSFDGSEELLKIAKSRGCKNIRQALFTELDDVNEYDLVWAYASLLHANKTELREIFAKIHTALKKEGLFFFGVKYGEFEGIKNDRYWTDFTEEKFEALLAETSGFEIVKMWTMDDVRVKQNRSDKWLDVILQKTARDNR